MKNVKTGQEELRALTVRQAKFVAEMMTGATIRDAAKAVGIEERTAHSYMVLPQVQEALQHAKTSLLETAQDIILKRYTDALEASCQVVIQIMLDAESPAASRLKAAQMIQDQLLAISPESEQDTEEKTGGINWIIFTPEELAIILPIFEAAEKRVELIK